MPVAPPASVRPAAARRARITPRGDSGRSASSGQRFASRSQAMACRTMSSSMSASRGSSVLNGARLGLARHARWEWPRPGAMCSVAASCTVKEPLLRPRRSRCSSPSRARSAFQRLPRTLRHVRGRACGASRAGHLRVMLGKTPHQEERRGGQATCRVGGEWSPDGSARCRRPGARRAGPAGGAAP